jgi:hypothetical protein
MQVAKLSDFEQFNKLKEINLLPFNYRQFYHFATFTFSLTVTNKRKLALKDRIIRNTNNKIHTIKTRRSYAIPLYIADIKKYSFTSIASKLLNSLKNYKIRELNNNLFKKLILKNFINIYNSSIKFWT